MNFLTIMIILSLLLLPFFGCADPMKTTRKIEVLPPSSAPGETTGGVNCSFLPIEALPNKGVLMFKNYIFGVNVHHISIDGKPLSSVLDTTKYDDINVSKFKSGEFESVIYMIPLNEDIISCYKFENDDMILRRFILPSGGIKAGCTVEIRYSIRSIKDDVITEANYEGCFNIVQ